jgi:drug/metabolite transporter (DMT)-like permease
LFSGALGTIFYTAALGKVQYVQFSVVVLLQQLQPIWAILMASFLLKEKIEKKLHNGVH